MLHYADSPFMQLNTMWKISTVADFDQQHICGTFVAVVLVLDTQASCKINSEDF